MIEIFLTNEMYKPYNFRFVLDGNPVLYGNGYKNIPNCKKSLESTQRHLTEQQLILIEPGNFTVLSDNGKSTAQSIVFSDLGKLVNVLNDLCQKTREFKIKDLTKPAKNENVCIINN